MTRLIFLLICLFSTTLIGKMHHHSIDHGKISSNSYFWKINDAEEFDEMLISWNSMRPKKGYYAIYVSVNSDKWSPWLLYAKWGSDFQKSFSSKKENQNVRVFQDAVEVLKNKKGTGFKIKIVGKSGADLSGLKSLHICTSELNSFSHEPVSKVFESSFLNVKGLSQMALLDSRKERLCSPTSTTAVVRFLKNENLDPIQFAESSWDSGFDIFGNWVFNVAEANNKLANERYSCWVERFDNFSKILDSLSKGLPTIISIRGPLPGSALPYKSGHLLVVIGYDRETDEVYCMDPAFNNDNETWTKYKLNDLLQAWERRKNVAYVFNHIN